jgi:hypothetical protein
MPLKQFLGAVSPKLARQYSDAADRTLKMGLVLGLAASIFWLAEVLESFPTADPRLLVSLSVRHAPLPR